MKVVWDSSLETQRTSYLSKAIRHHSSWNHLTSYYKSHFVSVKQYNEQTWLKRVEDRYYMTYDMSMTRIPTYVAETIMGKDRITHIIGPYVFFNNFEETADGKYLIKMLPHWFNRKPVVDLKIRNIMEYAGYWVRIHTETLKLMQEWQNGSKNK